LHLSFPLLGIPFPLIFFWKILTHPKEFNSKVTFL
jgi:hypothetical protein